MVFFVFGGHFVWHFVRHFTFGLPDTIYNAFIEFLDLTNLVLEYNITFLGALFPELLLFLYWAAILATILNYSLTDHFQQVYPQFYFSPDGPLTQSEE